MSFSAACDMSDDARNDRQQRQIARYLPGHLKGGGACHCIGIEEGFNFAIRPFGPTTTCDAGLALFCSAFRWGGIEFHTKAIA
jgi:hypothetical protein